MGSEMCIRDRPKLAPARVFVSPLGTGRNTSAARAIITIREVSNKLPCDHTRAFWLYEEKEVSRKIKGRIKEVNRTIKKRNHFTHKGIFIEEL